MVRCLQPIAVAMHLLLMVEREWIITPSTLLVLIVLADTLRHAYVFYA